ncbi:hypothetical protein [Vibrio sp. D431a]|uniref:hypothetical protein n=1 Tax=Vibrio sp. D431a TaxID=2837388 RepID=UPI002552B1DD|nr:hypothetical protein [Vibrio sp. D431a]MDK9790680.1 hypothetical protein [Vibrio sp. D431a]
MKNIIEHGGEIIDDILALLELEQSDENIDLLNNLKVAATSCVEAATLTKSNYLIAEFQRNLNMIDSVLIQISRDVE